HPLSKLQPDEETVSRIELGRLSSPAIEEVAALVVAPPDVRKAAEALEAGSSGLPLALVTLVNSLWDAGALVADAGGHWSFGGSWRIASSSSSSSTGSGGSPLRRADSPRWRRSSDSSSTPSCSRRPK